MKINIEKMAVGGSVGSIVGWMNSGTVDLTNVIIAGTLGNYGTRGVFVGFFTSGTFNSQNVTHTISSTYQCPFGGS